MSTFLIFSCKGNAAGELDVKVRQKTRSEPEKPTLSLLKKARYVKRKAKYEKKLEPKYNKRLIKSV